MLRPHPTPTAAVRWLLAAQAQDLPAARWAIGLRVPGSTDAAINQAISTGEIVRTHLLRGTWQLVLPADLGRLLPLVAPTVLAGNARRYQQLRLDGATLERADALLCGALASGNQTRKALGEALAAGGIDPTGQRLPYMLQHAELCGHICSGEMHGKKPTYALLRDRTHTQPAASLAAVAARYFSSRPRATDDDFFWWTGLPRAPLPPRPQTTDEPPSTHLLPAFDEQLVSYRHRDHILDPAHARRINAGGGMIAPSVLLRGRIVGRWRRKVRARHVDITVSPFLPLSAADHGELSAAAARYGAFLAREATLTISER